MGSLRLRAAVLASLAVAALLPASGARAHTVPITINHMDLSTPEASNLVGHPIVWENASPIPRSVASHLGVFASGVLLLNDTFTWGSTVAGTFGYTADLLGLGAVALDGTVTVRPIQVGQRFGRTLSDRYQWGMPGRVPDGLVFEVQRGVGRLGTPRIARWTWLHRGTRATAGWMDYRCDGRAYTIRVRVRDAEGNRSGWAQPEHAGACIA